MMDTAKNDKKPDPRLQANILSRLLFCWIIPIFSHGRKHDFTAQETPNVFPKDVSEYLGDLLERNWQEEINSALECKRKPKLQRAIMATLGWPFKILGLTTFLLLVVIKPVQIMFLGLLIGHFAPSASSSSNDAYLYASVVIIATLADSGTFCHTLYQARQLGMRLRIASSSLICRKMMRLSCASANLASGGLVINLLSNDVARFDVVINFLHYIWVMPIQIVVIAYFMWYKMGLVSLIGLVALILQTIPIQVYLGKLVHALRKKVTVMIDRRVLLVNEMINGIRVIKMYTWEPVFQQLLRTARRKEINVLAIVNYLKGASSASFFYINRIALFVTILVYVLEGDSLSTDKIFMLFQFYSIIQHTQSIALLQGLYNYAETSVSLNRIQKFLLSEEIPRNNNNRSEKIDENSSVEMIKVNASWTDDSLSHTLNNIDIKIAKKSLCAVTGPVGSGKSSFLKLILGELQPREGRISVNGDVSYSSQDPWLFASSIKDNILLGEPCNSDKYNRVIRACCLAEDLKQLAHGDNTNVGDKGAALSGGQCARVNVARTVYRDADIYLLDDPFSALDTRVNKRLFEDCVDGYLKDKTRIVVTHQERFLENADMIIHLEKGRVAFQGDFEGYQKFCNATENVAKKEPPEKSSTKETSLDPNGSDDIVSNFEENADESNATEELLSKGKMKKTLYWKYFKACGSYFLLLLAAICFLLAQVFITGSDYWLAFWLENKDMISNENNSLVSNVENRHNTTVILPIDETDDIVKNFGLHIYGLLILGTVVMSTIRNTSLCKICKNSSYNIHNLMINSVLKAPMRFFNENPSGRILNRFSKDLGSVDEILAHSMTECFQRFSLVAGILIQILIINWWLVFPMSIMLFIQLKIKNVYLATAQKIKRIEGNAKSPVLSLANSSLSGLLTIRSCRAETIVCKQFDNQQDIHTPTFSLVLSTVTSFGYWIDFISICFVSVVTFSFIVFDKGHTSDEKVGLAITQVLGLCDNFQYGMKLAGEIVSHMISVERLFQFTKLEEEGPLENEPGKEPPKNWPDRGEITFDRLYLRYNDDVEPILKDLSLKVEPGTKVGIVGRTGAGKSSLMSALLHMAQNDGKLSIDEVDVNKISLRELRDKVCVIPQEPVLFSISLRDNLDPLCRADDASIWRALQEVNLEKIFFSLDQPVNQKNLSTGQRQLLCLARAIIKKSKLLMLDEATANIDPDTDVFIQKTIRRNFNDCTVLTIAHRLNTIMDSDKVLVMDHGEAVEYDHPYVLLKNKDGYFTRMIKQLDSDVGSQLRKIAEDAYKTTEIIKSDSLSHKS